MFVSGSTGISCLFHPPSTPHARHRPSSWIDCCAVFVAFILAPVCDFSVSSGYVRENCDHREWREELQCDGLASRVGGRTPSSYIKVQITVHLHATNTYTSKNLTLFYEINQGRF